MSWSRIERRMRAWLADGRHNRRGTAGDGPRVLVLRERDRLADAHDDLIAWADRTHSGAGAMLRLHRWPGRKYEPDRYDLFVPWLQDPVRERDPRLFEYAMRLQQHFDEAGKATINRVENLSHAIKSVGSRLLRAAGLEAPLMVRIDDPRQFAADPEATGMTRPFFVREDQTHGPPVFLVHEPADLTSVPWEVLRHPVAVAWVDVRSGDGLYRKWRAMVVGGRVLPRHLVASPHWFVHAKDRVFDDPVMAEERAYIESGDDPHAADLLRAAKHLGLDTFAVDYSRLPDGRLIVWEVNPIPTLWAGFNDDPRYRYQRPAVERIYEALLDLYRDRAGTTASAEADI